MITVVVTECVLLTYEFDSTDLSLTSVDYIMGDVPIYRTLPSVIQSPNCEYTNVYTVTSVDTNDVTPSFVTVEYDSDTATNRVKVHDTTFNDYADSYNLVVTTAAGSAGEKDTILIDVNNYDCRPNITSNLVNNILSTSVKEQEPDTMTISVVYPTDAICGNINDYVDAFTPSLDNYDFMASSGSGTTFTFTAATSSNDDADGNQV